MKLKSGKIENTAVLAIINRFNKSNMVFPRISVGDKEPVWDGHLYLEQDIDGSNYQRIPVQVKGKQVDKIPNKTTYPINITNLKNYMRDGGVIFFLVYIVGEELEEVPYYAKIAPIDAKRYINKANKQKIINVSLAPLSTNTTELEFEFRDFHRDCKRQTSFADSPIITLEDAIKKYQTINWTISYNPKEEEAITRRMNNGVYLYSEVSPHVHLPIGDQSYKITFVSQTINNAIRVNDNEYFTHYTVTSSDKKKITIKFGNEFTLDLDFRYNKIEVQYEEKSIMLSERYKSLCFLNDLIKNQTLFIGEKQLSIAAPNQKNNCDIIKKTTLLKDTISVFKFLGVNHDINIEYFENSNWSKIKLLIDGLIHEKVIKAPEQIMPIMTISVASYTFMIVVEKDKKGVRIYDFFKVANKFRIIAKNDNNEIAPTSYFSIFFREGFIMSNNVDYKDLIPSYERIAEGNSAIYDIANADFINALSYYDKTSVKDETLFQALESLSSWILEKTNGTPEAIINKFQLIKRKRKYTKEEKLELGELLTKTGVESKLIQLATCLLLDNIGQSKIIFESLTNEERSLFESWPISYFMPSDKE